jgi:copper(I)-binding protein
MVIGLKKALKDGYQITITLQFSGDIRKTITIPVKPRDARHQIEQSDSAAGYHVNHSIDL